jgi:hypothetical protein
LAGRGRNLAGDQRADRRFREATSPITANAPPMTAYVEGSGTVTTNAWMPWFEDIA